MGFILNNDYELARRAAEKNRGRIISQIPPDLAQREETLFMRLSTSKGSFHEKLQKLYVFMDDLYAFIGKFIPCRKGCSDCCYIEVSISSLEAQYIENNLGVRQSPNLNRKDLFGSACPFLDNRTCSIYKYRPFVCRRHIALFDNPKWCHLDLCNKYSFPNITSTEIERSYIFILTSSGDSSCYDIRQLFQKPRNKAKHLEGLVD